MREPMREVRFHNPRLQNLGVDTLTVSQLRSKCPPEHFARPERLEFYQLIHFKGGKGRHEVDFRRYRIRKGTLIIGQPKQVQQFHLDASLRGRLLLIDPFFLSGFEPGSAGLGREMAEWPAWLELPTWLNADVTRTLDVVARETAEYRGDRLTARFLQHVIAALFVEIQRFVRVNGPGNVRQRAHVSEVLRLLNREVESQFAREHSVRFYARRLGYSEKTLTRASVAAAGKTAKELIDERVALEAKRLLAHSGASIVEIGSQLGFSEATNFVKFFKRMAGVTPSLFRRGYGSG
ncbi:MAG: helix-turn-helix domain-containing protein [Acidobacteria bacterium]|nr:helix-turn-helix domain-containing protein [Acidobacteriota bacterium]